MQSNYDIPTEIRELNMSYLLLAQRMLREDRDIGMFRLGISAEVAGILGSLTIAQVMRIANINQLLCRFRMDDRAFLSALADKGRSEVQQTRHAAILMAGQPAEQL
ncbi:flagellar transcriptional regulator FlhD [Paraburkholderia fungorum]|uniref:Flagellar transcriptional regulator FlhD n=1 Tax=Paraburkholderia fungorum TaxID=134537 RepID=A0AAW3V5B4_9BURK|nr:flagellar transcriptional regulator FlhD [Paraburkholderia fungorum]MBB4517292.1 flagellar transcriptional activator FlhD [Paraburkholderia fungorum]MBB6204361.1 flagellar transcriptional activator FlhD [Paraburkholderia fungorum]